MVGVLTLIIGIWPVEYGITRCAFAIGAIVTWIGALIFFWRRKVVRAVLSCLAIFGVVAVCLPSRDIDSQQLSSDYVKALRCYRGVRYVWGGEGFLGIDCSGLPRKALVWTQLVYGLRTLNGGPIRNAVDLWIHDSSARALRDGYRGWTTNLSTGRINEIDHQLLHPGDVAVTYDGVHTLVYLGNKTWLEADPGFGEVVELTAPGESAWLKMPVVFLRWKWL